MYLYQSCHHFTHASFLWPFTCSADISAVNWVLEELFSNTFVLQKFTLISQSVSVQWLYHTLLQIEWKLSAYRLMFLVSVLAEPLPQKSFFGTEAALHSLLGALTSLTYNDPTQHLEREQALAKQFAEILHFTLRFDELKVRRLFLPTLLLFSVAAFKPQTHHLDIDVNTALFSCDTNQTYRLLMLLNWFFFLWAASEQHLIWILILLCCL